MIGSAIAEYALNLDCDVLCIVRKHSNRISNLPKSDKLRILEANLEDYENLYIEGKYDEFYHLAWSETFGKSRDDVEIQLSNIKYSINAVKLAYRCGCSVFVGAGSQAEYGIAKDVLNANTAINPNSGYGIAKYAAGKFTNLLCSQLGIKHNWVRILSIYGHLDASHSLIMYVINELKNGRSPKLTNCDQIWDYLHCYDAARALLAIGKSGKPGKTYVLGSGEGKKLSEYMEDIRNLINPSVKLGFGLKEYYPHQPMYLVADISELVEDTRWKPEISFKKGIEEIIIHINKN